MMDDTLKKACLEEIGHTVLDSLQKISVRTISNNYDLSFLEAVKVLQQWIDSNSTKAKLTMEFIVRGVDSKMGGAFITVANEKKLKTIQAKISQVSSVLYSVEVAAESSRKLTIPADQEFKVINLPLKPEKRDIKVFTPVDPPATAAVKQETKAKSNSLFASSTSKPASKPDPPKPAVKDEKKSPPAPSKQETGKTSSQKTPTKGSPSKKKDAKKPASGKASISSFFSNKPAAAKPSQPATTSANVKAEKDSPKEKPKESPKAEKSKEKKDVQEKRANGAKEDESQRWKRMISDESEEEEAIPNTPQEKKVPAKKGGAKKPLTFKKKGTASKANPSKKSRILQVEDSSEEEEEDKNLKEPEERMVVFDSDDGEGDVEMRDEEDAEDKKKAELSPEKPVENDSNSLNRGKARVKKLVTKTFMDEEGYLTTVKEYEMVSASEDEAGDVSNNNSNAESTGKKETPKESSDGKGKGKGMDSDKKPSSKKVTPPTPKTKQGSIMNFFSKK